jgi:hypothetical protein
MQPITTTARITNETGDMKPPEPTRETLGIIPLQPSCRHGRVRMEQ